MTVFCRNTLSERISFFFNLNWQNCRTWRTENPFKKNQCIQKKCIVWCELCVWWIVGPYFYCTYCQWCRLSEDGELRWYTISTDGATYHAHEPISLFQIKFSGPVESRHRLATETFRSNPVRLFSIGLFEGRAVVR